MRNETSVLEVKKEGETGMGAEGPCATGPHIAGSYARQIRNA
jgi:ATP-dependent protease HslVU (ClpYQ) peptidase subunit